MQRRYRYSFDDLGYYMGLCYPLEESALQTPIFPPNSTEQEPFWKDGYIPRYDFHFKNWILEKRGQKEVRQTIEDELTEKIINKIFEKLESIHHVSEYSFQVFSKNIFNKFENQNRFFDSLNGRIANLFALTDRMDETTSKDIKEIKFELILLHKNIVYIEHKLIEIMTKPTLWQKIKSFFTGNTQ